MDRRINRAVVLLGTKHVVCDVKIHCTAIGDESITLPSCTRNPWKPLKPYFAVLSKKNKNSNHVDTHIFLSSPISNFLNYCKTESKDL
jgi:hypothetical protein